QWRHRPMCQRRFGAEENGQAALAQPHLPRVRKRSGEGELDQSERPSRLNFPSVNRFRPGFDATIPPCDDLTMPSVLLRFVTLETDLMSDVIEFLVACRIERFPAARQLFVDLDCLLRHL